MNEQWNKISGFEDYDVSNFGNIRSWKYSNSPNLLKKNKIGNKDKSYLKVTLRKDKKSYIKFVHILVATTFLQKNNGKQVVNHIDGDRMNNHVSNLEWCTQRENIRKFFIKKHNKNKCKTCTSYFKHIYDKET